MSLKALRAEIQGKTSIDLGPDEELIEIRSGIKVPYSHNFPMFTLNNFLAQSIGMWLWKYALCPMFEERVRADDLRKTITLCYPKRRLNNRLLGQIINCMRLETARIQYSDFGRAYGWKWNGKEDLATSMWLFTKTWIYDMAVVEWNNTTAVAPGDESRQAIEEELITLDFHAIVQAYYYDRLKCYQDWEIAKYGDSLKKR